MLTINEEIMLKEFPKNDFYEEGLDSKLWTDCFIDRIPGINPSQCRGVLTSLKKKGFIEGDDMGKDSCIWLTERGKEWIIENKIVDERGKRIRKI